MPDWSGGVAPKDLVGDVGPDVTVPVAEEAASEASSGEAAAQKIPDIDAEVNSE
ncbi:hypothetical protein GCM10010339_58940 [Streptomyces alanosinicus]|uniref:Uncharacterized protein n=1 Tax=Streptomyces alanosinicus TaxID=68171 RepID=A0A919D4X8_9ACTN|nr:hypothetical protein GCM10010339_58940 [Streptomyces alanosinicus]